MAEARNKIERGALHEALRVELAAYWRGIGPERRPHTVKECIAWLRDERGIEEEDLPGDNAFTAWKNSADFTEMCERARTAAYGELTAEARRRGDIWKAIEQGGGLSAGIKMIIFRLLAHAEAATTGDLDVGEMTKLMGALAKAQTQADSAAINEKDTKITELLAEIAALKNSGTSRGLSSETLKEIETKAKIL